ncbi:hypothetical protein PENTCL1PPCAC_20966, partial [Pristionchus entomophagus]
APCAPARKRVRPSMKDQPDTHFPKTRINKKALRTDKRIGKRAVQALETATDGFLLSLFVDAARCAENAGRTTVRLEEVALALGI